jgi:hypothetical protein
MPWSAFCAGGAEAGAGAWDVHPANKTKPEIRPASNLPLLTDSEF